MVKPVVGFMVIAMLLVGGCAGSPADQTEVSPSETSSAPASPTSETSSAIPASPATTETDPSEQLTDTVFIPGEQFGPVTQTTTREDLANWFGEANLTDQDIPAGEGFTEPGTVVNLGADRSFTVVWNEPRTQPLMIRDPGPAWKTPEGIGMGVNFSKLQEILGEFKVYGFGWDYGGTVVLEGSQLANYYGELIMRVQPSSDAVKQSSDFQAVMGEQLFPYTDPNLQSLDLRVDEMLIYLAPQTE
jgi:hypothetical protein